MPPRLKPLQTKAVTSFVDANGKTCELRSPQGLATQRQLWTLNEAGLLAIVQERPRPISKGQAAGAIDYLTRKRARLAASFERKATRLRVELEEARRDLQAHDAALAFEECGSWQEAARRTGYRDGSAARQAVELRTDYRDVDGARLAGNRQHRIGRLAWLEGADERRRGGGTRA